VYPPRHRVQACTAAPSVSLVCEPGGGLPGEPIRPFSDQHRDNEARAFETFLPSWMTPIKSQASRQFPDDKKRHHYLKDNQHASHLPEADGIK